MNPLHQSFIHAPKNKTRGKGVETISDICVLSEGSERTKQPRSENRRIFRGPAGIASHANIKQDSDKISCGT
jgi:hypothetical protein